jgi:hypothetical protein
MLKTKIEVTSQNGGQIPVLGTFEPGETKVIDELTQHQFRDVYGYPVTAGHYVGGVTCSVTFEEEAVEASTGEGEEA